MNIRQLVKKSETIVGLVHDFKKVRYIIWEKSSRTAIKRYVKSHPIRRMQIGAGNTVLHGWLNTDLSPVSDSVVFLNAVKPFLIDDNTFDYIHCEHLIEHISWQEGMAMLRECHHILKPGGTIRIATPDLEVICHLVDKDPFGEKYIKWVTDKYLEGISVYKASFAINNAFTNWGHRFLYDSDTLKMALSDAGFVNIRRYSVGESDDQNLLGIEMHDEVAGDKEMVAFETMVFEGKCG
jgi:predicted SAM-dependent methyltransferase